MAVISAFLRLIRWFNLIIVAFIIFLTKFCLADPLSQLAGIPLCMSEFHWWLIGLATVAIAASGNVVNDIMDQEIDRHNQPDKVIVGKLISENSAWNIYYALTAIGLIAGIWAAELLSSDYHGMVFIFSAASLWFYSQHLKLQFLVGNITISMLAALVLLVPFFMEYRCTISNEITAQAIKDHGGRITFPWQSFVFLFAAFSFLTTLIRELVKDCEDMDGDSAEGAQTIPLKIGFTGAKWVAMILTIVLMIAVASMQTVRFNSGDEITFYYLIAGVQIPCIILMVLLFTAQHPQDMKAPSALVKVVMLGGILSMLTLRYSFLNA